MTRRCSGVLVVGFRELGTIDYQLGRNDNFAALEGELNEVAFRQVGLLAYPRGNAHLPLCWILAVVLMTLFPEVRIHVGLPGTPNVQEEVPNSFASLVS